MKRFVPLYVMGMVLVFASVAALPSALAETTLNYSSFFPPTHIQSQLAESWCKEVEKRTEGRVKVQYFAGQTLTKAKQTYDSILDGIADVGTSALAYTKGRFPVMSAIDLPFGYPSGVAATAAANDLYMKLKPVEFDDTQVMYFNAHGPGFIHTRDTAVRSLEDLKGLKIRSTGMSANVVKALGATPVPMPMPDSYQALQKGVVDGSAYPVEANKGWKLGEVVKYVTYAYPAAYTTCFFVVMNKDKWRSLDPKDQKIIGEINREWAVKHGEAWDTSDKDGEGFFLSRDGNEIISVDDGEAAKWGEAVAHLIDEYAKELDGKGVDGTTVVGSIRESLVSRGQ
jgi:TRAP-type C4-dicarboxylate transport system substrate-binding protein